MASTNTKMKPIAPQSISGAELENAVTKKARGDAPKTRKRLGVNEYKDIRQLPYYNQIVHRLSAGDRYTDVARWIQQQGDCTDVTETALASRLRRLMQRLPPVDVLSVKMPEQVQRAAESLHAGLNELEEMEDLYRIQKERIMIDFEKEKMIGKLFKGTGNEVSIALSLLVAMAELKQRLGLTENRLGTLAIDANILTATKGRYGNASVQRVLSDPDSRRKVLNVVNHIIGHPEIGSIARQVRDRILAEKAASDGGSDDQD